MSKRMMQAIRVHQYGGPEQLKLEQIPCPVPIDLPCLSISRYSFDSCATL